MTEQPSTLAAALVEVQRQLPVLHRDKVATVESQRGKFTYRYVDLASVTEVVLPLLAEQRLAFISRPTVVDGHFVLSCSLVFAPTGEREEAILPLPTGTTAQVLGSWLSYGRRYLLACLTGLATSDEDDDGAAASPRRAPAKATRRREASTRATPTRSTPTEPPDEIQIERRRRAMFAQLKDYGYRDSDPKRHKEIQLNFIRSVLDWPDLQSRAQLNDGHVSAVLAALEAGAGDDHSETPA